MRKFGDRADGRRIKTYAMSQLILDINSKRCESDVYINQEMDVTELCKYIENRKENGDTITYFHAFVSAIGKLYYNMNKLNRFVANRHLYEHNDIVISFVAKVAFEDSAEEMMILVKIDDDDNIDTISKKILDKVNSIRNNKKIDKKGANNAIEVVGKLPNIIRVPLVGILKFMDKKGILPRFLIEDNLYYSSLIVSNLGSIKCGAILHHLSDFGSCSGLATMGEIKDKEVLINGKKEIRKIVEFGINLDERIADGYYFAKSVKVLQYFFDNPKLLEDRADTKIDLSMINYRK